MGLVVFTKSGIFKPADYGLSQGDPIDVILVGAGGFGARGVESILPGHGAGGDTSLGTYAVAKSAYGASGGFGWGMATGYGNYYSFSGGGGGGGYIPGAPFQGGCGASAPKTTGSVVIALQGNGGGATQPGYAYNNTWYAQPTASLGGGGSCFGGGNASYGNTTAEGGAGYGAGGGCAGYSTNSSGYLASYVGCGGYAGQIIYYSHVLTAEDVINGIPVTVGAAAVYIKAGAYSATEYAADNTSKVLPTISTGWTTQIGDISVYLRSKLQSVSLIEPYFKHTSTASYGVQPFCAYKDGTVFLAVTPAAARNSAGSFDVAAIFVYSGIAHKVFAFSNCFPGFNSPYSPRSYIYRVDNFFVQYNTHGSSGTPDSNYITFKYIPVDVALSGAATSSDVKTIKWLRPGSSTGSYSWGFDAAGGLICLTAANTYAYWDNWAPSRDQSTYVSKTVETSFWGYNNVNYTFIPYGTKGAVCCYFGTSYSNDSVTNALLTDAANGVQDTSTTVFSQYICGVCEGTNEVYRMCCNYSSSYAYGDTYGIRVQAITTNPYKSSAASLTSTAKIFFAGAWREYNIYSVMCNTSYANYSYVTGFMWPTVDGGWIVMAGSTSTSTAAPYNVSEAYRVGLVVALKYVLSGLSYGYDNNGGIPGMLINNTYGLEGIAGGAGGCCQITW